MTDKKQLGYRGENLAEKYLVNQGYRIIDKNYRLGRREIDLIARQKNNLAFIEVKTRIKSRESLAENPLTLRQLNNLKRAIRAYCYLHHLNSDSARLDLIVILVDKERRRAALRHYLNII